MGTARKILHVDMDAFYAAIEQRDRPELAGRPIAVGGSSERGVVMTASYEARPAGIHSAMPSVQAKRLCPELVFVRPRMEAYKEEGYRIRTIFHRYTDLVEPVSLDEAFLDVTEPKQGPPSATLLARAIRDEIQQTTGLTASAGAAASKFVAKVASDWDKPDGLTVVPPDREVAFIARLPIEHFPGVGTVTAEKMHGLGIRTGKDLQNMTEDQLSSYFGKRGRFFYRLARGRDKRPVSPDRTRKSVGAERTYSSNLTDHEDMISALDSLAERVSRRLDRAGARGRTITLKVKFANFQVRTWSKTVPRSLAAADELAHVAAYLLRERAHPERPVRLLGIAAQKLQFEKDVIGYQLPLPFESSRTPAPVL
jgi:DNA polymerase-4